MRVGEYLRRTNTESARDSIRSKNGAVPETVTLWRRRRDYALPMWANRASKVLGRIGHRSASARQPVEGQPPWSDDVLLGSQRPVGAADDTGTAPVDPAPNRARSPKVRSSGPAIALASDGGAEDRSTKPPTSSRPRRLPSHFDEGAVRTILRVRPRTMTSHWKVFGLILSTRYIEDHDIPGDIVECGVWRGGSMQAAALTLMESGSSERQLHLFDTFEGMPPPSEYDSSGGLSAEVLLSQASREDRIWAVASLEDVRAGMAETGYPTERIHYHVGQVEQTVPSEAPDQIAILRLDTDWYESTKHELEHLYDRLSPGGVLIIDDYGNWDGARKATDEWLEKTRAKLLLLPMHGGRIAVKPGI